MTDENEDDEFEVEEDDGMCSEEEGIDEAEGVERFFSV